MFDSGSLGSLGSPFGSLNPELAYEWALRLQCDVESVFSLPKAVSLA